MQNTTIRENIDFYIGLIVGISALIFVIWYNINYPRITVRYDCSIAEISPDYPIKVKEECRKLNAENYQKNLQKPK